MRESPKAKLSEGKSGVRNMSQGGNALRVRQDEDRVEDQGKFKLWESDVSLGNDVRERLSQVRGDEVMLEEVIGIYV